MHADESVMRPEGVDISQVEISLRHRGVDQETSIQHVRGVCGRVTDNSANGVEDETDGIAGRRLQ